MSACEWYTMARRDAPGHWRRTAAIVVGAAVAGGTAMWKPHPHPVIAFCTPAVALLLSATAGPAATPLLRAGEGPEGKALYFWDVNQSWPGREQADARLDQPVRAWYAAIPVAALLASLEQQTGVHLACWPAGDDSERICVTVYLNPEQPPSLRDVMAQLSWVLDCSFACTSDGAPRTYYLLRSSLGDGVLKRLAKVAQQAREAVLAEGERLRRQTPGLVRAKLEEYRQALSVPPDELAKQHPTRLSFGAENADEGYLLLNMVDPAQRAATQFVLSLSPADLDAVLSFKPLTRRSCASRLI